MHNAKGKLLETSLFTMSSGHQNGYEVKLEDLKEEEIFNDFDSVSTLMVENYPETSEWYAKTKENIINLIQDKKAELTKSTQGELQSDTSIIEKKQLKIQNKKLMKMLEKALIFIENVKKHPLGKIFFHKKIKEFDRDTNTLESGEEFDRDTNTLENEEER